MTTLHVILYELHYMHLTDPDPDRYPSSSRQIRPISFTDFRGICSEIRFHFQSRAILFFIIGDFSDVLAIEVTASVVSLALKRIRSGAVRSRYLHCK
jgi:hypothetical protein